MHPEAAGRRNDMSDALDSSPVALVVGASRGLGLLIAGDLLDRGYAVVIAARDADELDRAAGQLGGRGPVTVHVCDVRRRDEVESMVAAVEAGQGPIEVAITVAGIIDVGPAEEMGWDAYEDAMATMAWGPIHVALSVLPGMKGRGFGHIGTIASIGGMVAAPHLLPYTTAKFAAVGFSDGLAAELAGTGVTATTAAPGLMRTGGHTHARFTGHQEEEYAWFAPGASLPLLSADAERAARRIVSAVLAGRPFVTVTPLAWVGIRVRGLVPGTTTRMVGLVNRLLPEPRRPGHAPTPETTRQREGASVARTLGSRVVNALSTLGDRAARRHNEL